MLCQRGGWTVIPVLFPAENELKTYNFFLLAQNDSLLLIDAGIDTDPCWHFFLETLDQHQFRLQDLKGIILTHNHVDHVGLVNRILDQVEVPIFAHLAAIPRLKRDKNFFEMRINFFRQLYEEMGCGQAGKEQVERLLKAAQENEKRKLKGEILPLKEGQKISGLMVAETPGHSPDHLIFYDGQRKWVFGGDLLIAHISSNAIVEPDHEGRKMLTLIQHIQSLQKCFELEAELFFPGHGELITDHRGLIQRRLQRIEEKSEKLLELINQGIRTADQLARTYYKNVYQQQFSLVMSEIIGHLDYLEAKGLVEKEKKNGVWVYSPAPFSRGQASKAVSP